MEAALTPRQAEILEAIRDHIAEFRRPPSQPELARALGLASTNGVFKHLAALEKKGAIELSPGLARGIRIKQEGLPLVGRVAAGSPMLALENLLGTYPVDPSLFNPLGKMMQPELGKPVTLAHKEWTAHGGVFCLRFDAFDSPNFDHYTVETLLT